jgi:hypothetical protein
LEIALSIVEDILKRIVANCVQSFGS